MIFKATLGNANHPNYGVASIPFPIPKNQYENCMEMLNLLEIGNPRQKDCKVIAIEGAFPVLKRTESLRVNLDELNYLAKRLDAFDVGEAAQFQAAAHKLELFELKDLINLTFCCQKTTVITDFSDLEAVGKEHYMNLNGGIALTEDLENLDGQETALLLIQSGEGTITPYGVLYENGMKLQQLYDGNHFPCYHYEPEMLTVGLTSRQEPEDTPNVTWLYLPSNVNELERAINRSGITDPEDMCFHFGESQFPNEVDCVLDFRHEDIFELNALAEIVQQLSENYLDFEKLGAVVTLAEPEYAYQIRQLAENLDLFDFAPNVHTAEQYGKYMIQQSGHFSYDPNLEQFYNFSEYGQQRMNQEYGKVTDRGYISYHGTLSLEELMMEDPTEQMDFRMDTMG